MDAVLWVLIFVTVASIFIPLVLYLPRLFRTKKIPVYSSIRSVSYSPFSSLAAAKKVDVKMIRRELSLLKRYVPRIRTYSMSDSQDLIPGIAIELGLEVSLGIWLRDDDEKNILEITTAIELIKKHKKIRRVIVGSESLFRHEVQLWKLKEYIDYVKQAVDIPVTTAELWYTWLDNPSLAAHTDEITAHVLPFWEGVHVKDSVAYVLKVVATLTERFPGKKIYIGEIGWPSKGQSFISMPCDAYQQAEHIRTLVEALNEQQVDYNVIEAFDQKWKICEGTVGPHWGILSRKGSPKFLLGHSDTVPEESLRVFIFRFYRSAVGKALLLFAYAVLLVLFAEMIWRTGVESFWCNILVTAGWSLWFLTVSATGMHETVERFLMPRTEPVTTPTSDFDPSSLKVAFHVACRNEPAQMVIDTLFRLSHLDFGNYQVYVVDNNTSDETLWRPIEEYCKTLGDKFKFWHVDDLAGFKGGALNFLLEKTDPDTDVIAVVDSDYQVESDWLKLLFYFSDPELAVIQAPQIYRDRRGMFKKLCYFEYKSFFNTGMVIRDQFNAIILHGTMTLIRAGVLRRLGWAEWCVCEDAELGLRILIDRHKMKYVQISYGRGVMPDSFADYKAQRARWVAGALQILGRHFTSIFTLNTSLSWRQKYQFFIGWAHWLVQPASLLITLAVIIWTAAVLLLPGQDYHYSGVVSASLIAAFTLTLVAQALLYTRYSPDGTHGAWLSIMASHALNHIVAITVMRALVSHPKSFVVTPKMSGVAQVRSFPRDCLGELAVFSTMCVLAGLVGLSKGEGSGHALWAFMLMLRSIPYGLAVLMSVFSTIQDRDVQSGFAKT